MSNELNRKLRMYAIFSRTLFILSRLICLLLGILIILTVSPQQAHQKPRIMKHVGSRLLDEDTTVQVQVALINWKVQFSAKILIWAVCLLLACLICSSKYSRNALMGFVRKRWSLLAVMLLFLGFLLIKIFWAILILAAALILVLLFSMKKTSSPFLSDAKIFLLRLFALSIFLLTLKPTPGGWPVVLYLIFGSVSILLILIGIYPLRRLSGRLRSVFTASGQGLCNIFYNASPRLFLIFIFLFVFILANLGSYFLFDHIPHITDSILQVFHGKIFATGRLAAQSHPLKEFFNINPLMINDMRGDGKWYSVYPPGHSFMIMLGALVKAPWVINPLLLALTVVLIYFLGKEIYDEKTGRLAALLGAFSPFLLFMSSEFMNHVSTLFYATLFVLFFAKTVRGRKWYSPIISGAGLGMMINIRSYTAVAIALPFCIYSIYLLLRDFRSYVRPMVLLALVTLCFIGILMGFNYATNGSPTLFGYVVQFGREHNPGFGHTGHGGPPHTPGKGLDSSLEALNVLNKYLFGWPIPSLVFALILFLSGTRNKWDYLLISVLFALSFAYFFYWYTNWDCGFGPRFIYESSSMLILLTARGLLRVPDFVKNVLKIPVKERSVKSVIALSLILCMTVTLVYYVPASVKYYIDDFYKNIKVDLLKTVKKSNISNAVVFVHHDLYGSVFPANSPLLDGDIIYARDLGERNRMLMEYYPHRKYYRAEGSELSEIVMDGD